MWWRWSFWFQRMFPSHRTAASISHKWHQNPPTPVNIYHGFNFQVYYVNTYIYFGPLQDSFVTHNAESAEKIYSLKKKHINLNGIDGGVNKLLAELSTPGSLLFFLQTACTALHWVHSPRTFVVPWFTSLFWQNIRMSFRAETEEKASDITVLIGSASAALLLARPSPFLWKGEETEHLVSGFKYQNICSNYAVSPTPKFVYECISIHWCIFRGLRASIHLPTLNTFWSKLDGTKWKQPLNAIRKHTVHVARQQWSHNYALLQKRQVHNSSAALK